MAHKKTGSRSARRRARHRNHCPTPDSGSAVDPRIKGAPWSHLLLFVAFVFFVLASYPASRRAINNLLSSPWPKGNLESQASETAGCGENSCTGRKESKASKAGKASQGSSAAVPAAGGGKESKASKTAAAGRVGCTG